MRMPAKKGEVKQENAAEQENQLLAKKKNGGPESSAHCNVRKHMQVGKTQAN